ncbi:group II intron maturase-specific domain-containing protein [uncultured Ruminococcus sp.]|uniref:group II intron maturase-specific domain-containing protein n=1 Tax=uncultured Ruminococcus sp. TaxID=165186 RepID=UPI0037DC66AF
MLFSQLLRLILKISIRNNANGTGASASCYRLEKLNAVTRGWINYFSPGDMKSVIKRIDEHLMVQMRCSSGNSGKCLRNESGD